MIADVRGIGGVGIIELRTAKGGYLDEIGPKLTQEFVKRGLLLRPMGNILYFMPPYVITESEVDWVFDQIGEVLDDIA
jgi:adenosylmethionine-8-amino-7-oxononanoate aminotransferase